MGMKPRQKLGFSFVEPSAEDPGKPCPGICPTESWDSKLSCYVCSNLGHRNRNYYKKELAQIGIKQTINVQQLKQFFFSIAQDSVDRLMPLIRYPRNGKNFIYPNFNYKQCTLLARSERTFIE